MDLSWACPPTADPALRLRSGHGSDIPVTDAAHPGFEVHPAWKMAADRGVSGEEEESVMGVAKKAKHEAKAAKRKTKKDAGKVKHKGKKVKNAAKH